MRHKESDMRSVGVRELKERTGQILRAVSEGQSVEVTHRGKVMARLVPPPRSLSPEEIERILREDDELIQEIGRAQTRPIDMSELRRW
jgi:prevent-host-death family protein